MDFTIVIPVLNEEQSVEKVARGCLAAREKIQQAGGLDAVHVVVVSDGSTDRSVEIARSIDGVTTVVFEHNRGYGAAIQAGWEAKPAELVGFLDGDGTCDPEFFATLIERMNAEQADMALGSRMGADSRMPRLRRFGNWLFATLLGVLSRQSITDSASGMRVIRRSALPRLQPLPAGLHFTPSMSARAMMAEMKVLEIPMTYSEREGRSKLSVIKDGWRFLVTILMAAVTIRPSRITLPIVGLLVACAIALSLQPIGHYVAQHSLEEGMVYRFLLMALLSDIAVLLFCATLLTEHVIALTMLRYGSFRDNAPWWWRIPGLNFYLGLSAVGLLLGIWLTFPGFVAWLSTGTISGEQMHWSRVVLTSVLALTFMQLAVTRVLIQLLHGLEVRQNYLR